MFRTFGDKFQVLVEAVLECVHCSAVYYVTWYGIASGCYSDRVKMLGY